MRYSIMLFANLIAIAAAAQSADSLFTARLQVIHRMDSLMSNYQFEKALQVTGVVDSMDVDMLLRVGQCNFRLGISRAAIAPYERVLALDSINVTALNQLGQLYARDNELTSATLCYWRLIVIDSTNSYYYKQTAALAARAEDKVMAKYLYEKALSYNPSDAESSLALGNLLLDLEEFEELDSIIDNALILDPEHKSLILLRAKSAFEQHHYLAAIHGINGLLASGSADTLAVQARLLGASYFQLREYANVVKCMNFLLNHNYDNDWIYYYLGVASRELGDVPASIAHFRKAVEKSISENTGTYFSQLAQSYEEVKDYQSAIRAYRAAYNNSKEGILLYHLARTYDVYYKDKAQAVAYYKKYLESDDTIRLAKEYSRRRIETIGQ